MMESVYLKVSVEMGLRGWEEQRNVVCDNECRAVWKKKGDVGEWMLLMESVEDEQLEFVMSLKVGKELAAKMRVSADVMRLTDVDVVLESCRGAVVRLLTKELKGGYVCRNL